MPEHNITIQFSINCEMVCLNIDDKWLGGDKLMLLFTALHLNSSELKIMSVVSAELAHTFL